MKCKTAVHAARGVALLGAMLWTAGCGPGSEPARGAPGGRAAGASPAAVTAHQSPAQAATAKSPVAPPGTTFAVHPFPPPATLGGREWTYFRETGHYISGGFKAYFEANGGLFIFGYPITEELTEDGRTVQYFQRARLEFHPDASGEPVQRGLLAGRLLAAQPERRGQATLQPDAAPPRARAFPETGFWVEPPALEYFERYGGPATFGYPISPPAGGVQWFQRARLEWTAGAVQAALIGDEYLDLVGPAAAKQRAQPPLVGRADLERIEDDLDVHLSAQSAELVTRLPQDAQVRVTGEVRGPDGEVWYAVRLWNAVTGFVRRDGLAFTPAPLKRPGTSPASWQPGRPPPQGPFPLDAPGRLRAAGEWAAAPDGPAQGHLAAGVAVRATAYATDARARAWVQLGPGAAEAGSSAPAGAWVPAERFTPAAPDPWTATAGGELLAARVAGTGMWFTYDVLRQTPVEHIIATAKANNLSFLAPEVGTSRRGYWARHELDALLPAAHAAGLKVIPWIYVWLADIPADLELALAAARHVAPTGDRVDGIGVDLEEALDEPTVRAYGQLLRAAVGPETLLVAITFQPQIAAGRRTPYGAIAETYNVIAPMSYWHGRNVPHSYEDAYGYVAASVRLIRERAGAGVPVAVLGQTFDWFTRNEIGGGNPTAAEIRGAVQAARDSGALGIGFFNWFSTTPDEWEAIAEGGK